MNMTEDIAAFLRARLDEDEQAAQAAPPDPIASMARKFAAGARSLKAHLAEARGRNGRQGEAS